MDPIDAACDDVLSKVNSSNVIKLNVGGTKVTTTLDTLIGSRNDLLAHFFNNHITSLQRSGDDEIFIDRDPNLFSEILFFLRNGIIRFDCSFREILLEGLFWGLNILLENLFSISHKKTSNTRKTIHFKRLNLNYRQYERLKFCKIVFEQCSLTGCKFIDCDLTNVIFIDNKMTNIQFQNCKNETILSQAKSPVVRLHSAEVRPNSGYLSLIGYDYSTMKKEQFQVITDLSNADLTKANFYGQDVSNINFFGAKLEKTNFTLCVFKNVCLENIDFSQSELTNVTFNSVNFARCTFQHINFSTITLINCYFKYCNLQSVNLAGTNFENIQLVYVELADANLSDSNFKSFNFSTVNLSHANLKNCNLSNIDFRKFDSWKSANFEGANLSNSNFSGLDLRKINFTRTILVDSKFDSAVLSFADFTGANLSGIDFHTFSWEKAVFKRTNLSKANFSGLNLSNLSFVGCNFTKTNFSHCILIGARLNGVRIHKTNFAFANLSQIDFRLLKWDRCSLEHSILIGCNFRGLDLSGINFSHADLSFADLTFANLARTKLIKSNFTNTIIKEVNWDNSNINDLIGSPAGVVGNDSCIFTQSDKLFLTKWLKESGISYKWKLSYRGSVDGFSASGFHKCVDRKGATLIAIRDSLGYTFGGFSSVGWRGANQYLACDAFLYSLKNPCNIPPFKMSKVKSDRWKESSIYDNPHFGPSFGEDDLFVCNEMKSRANHVRPGFSYCLPENIPSTNTITIGEEFSIDEIEAFTVIKGENL